MQLKILLLEIADIKKPPVIARRLCISVPPLGG
jgi:hypothetical protein